MQSKSKVLCLDNMKILIPPDKRECGHKGIYIYVRKILNSVLDLTGSQ